MDDDQQVAEVRRDYRFEWFGVGPVQETNSAKGQPEHHGESVGKTGSEPAGEHGVILLDFDGDSGRITDGRTGKVLLRGQKNVGFRCG